MREYHVLWYHLNERMDPQIAEGGDGRNELLTFAVFSARAVTSAQSAVAPISVAGEGRRQHARQRTDATKADPAYVGSFEASGPRTS